MGVDGELAFTGVHAVKSDVRIAVGYLRLLLLNFLVYDNVAGFDVHLLHLIQSGEHIEAACQDHQHQHLQHKKQFSVAFFLFLRRTLSRIRSSLAILIIRTRATLTTVSALLTLLAITRTSLTPVLIVTRTALGSALTVLIRTIVLPVLAVGSLLITILAAVGISLVRLTVRAVILAIRRTLLIFRRIILSVFCSFSLISSL